MRTALLVAAGLALPSCAPAPPFNGVGSSADAVVHGSVDVLATERDGDGGPAIGVRIVFADPDGATTETVTNDVGFARGEIATGGTVYALFTNADNTRTLVAIVGVEDGDVLRVGNETFMTSLLPPHVATIKVPAAVGATFYGGRSKCGNADAPFNTFNISLDGSCQTTYDLLMIMLDATNRLVNYQLANGLSVQLGTVDRSLLSNVAPSNTMLSLTGTTGVASVAATLGVIEQDRVLARLGVAPLINANGTFAGPAGYPVGGAWRHQFGATLTSSSPDDRPQTVAYRAPSGATFSRDASNANLAPWIGKPTATIDETGIHLAWAQGPTGKARLGMALGSVTHAGSPLAVRIMFPAPVTGELTLVLPEALASLAVPEDSAAFSVSLVHLPDPVGDRDLRQLSDIAADEPQLDVLFQIPGVSTVVRSGP